MLLTCLNCSRPLFFDITRSNFFNNIIAIFPLAKFKLGTRHEFVIRNIFLKNVRFKILIPYSQDTSLRAFLSTRVAYNSFYRTFICFMSRIPNNFTFNTKLNFSYFIKIMHDLMRVDGTCGSRPNDNIAGTLLLLLLLYVIVCVTVHDRTTTLQKQISSAVSHKRKLRLPAS